MKKTSKYVLLLSAGLLLAPVALNHIVDVPTVYATETVASKELTISGGHYGMGVAIEPFTMTVKVGDTISIDDIKAKFNITATTQSFEMTDKEGAPTKRWNPGTTSIVVTEELLAYDTLSITFASSLSTPQPDQGHFAYYLNLVDGSIIRPNEINPKDWNGAPQIPGYIHVALYGEGMMGRSVGICYYVPEGTDLATVRRLIDEKGLGNFVVKNLDSLFLTEVAPVGNESSQSSNTGNTASVETPASDIGIKALFTATDFPGYSEEQVLAAQVAYTLHKIGGEAISPLFASGVKTTFSSKEAGSQATSFVPNVILPKKTYYIESGLTGIITYSTVITYSDNGDGTITVYSIPDSLDRLGTTLAEQEEKLNRLFNEGRVVSVLKPSKEEVLSRLQQMVGGSSSTSTNSTSSGQSESQSGQIPSGTVSSDSESKRTGAQEKSTGQTNATDKATDKKADKKNLPKTGQVNSGLALVGLALLPMVAYFHKKQKKN
ncbi:TPA: LPXTG cell wall anchor domain-containing protein [Streptococcus suis]|nr:LPXTG cell wall anchor domain-containing protein [Streptococcus suis]